MLVHSVLAFEIFSRFPISSSKLLMQGRRMKVLALVQMEMNSIIAEGRVKAALDRQISLSADRIS